jgi:Holliday junction resolvase RusA-like endonuclease
MPRVSFIIPGEPRGKARPRSTARIVWKDGAPMAVVTVHSDPAMRAAEKEVLQLFRQAHPRHRPFTGPVLMKFVAVFEIPRSWPKKLQAAAREGTLFCTKKPDKDNIEKLITDALTPPQRKRGAEGPAPSPAGYAWVADEQVMGGGVKRYGYPPRIEVTLEELPQPDLVAIPSQRRLEARVDAPDAQRALSAPKANPHKAGKNHPPTKLQQAIDAALARDAQRKLL